MYENVYVRNCQYVLRYFKHPNMICCLTESPKNENQLGSGSSMFIVPGMIKPMREVQKITDEHIQKGQKVLRGAPQLCECLFTTNPCQSRKSTWNIDTTLNGESMIASDFLGAQNGWFSSKTAKCLGPFLSHFLTHSYVPHVGGFYDLNCC